MALAFEDKQGADRKRKGTKYFVAHIRDSKTVLDSGFLGDGSGFFVSGT